MLPKNVQMMWPKDLLTQGLAILTNALRMVWAHNRNQGILGCSLKKLLLIIIPLALVLTSLLCLP